MTEKELDSFTEQEVSWLRYYGLESSRDAELFNDALFYDRMASIGYCKRVIALWRRCPQVYITSDIPVMEAAVEDLKAVSGPRDHENNVYTPLEYVFVKNHGRHEEFRITLKSKWKAKTY
jgi:hypothetical protein